MNVSTCALPPNLTAAMNAFKRPFPADADSGESAKKPSLTSTSFYITASGSNMLLSGIEEGDVLVVEPGLNPGTNQLVLLVMNGELSVKRISKYNDVCYLIPENSRLNPIEISPTMDVEIKGVITHVIHKV